MLAGYFEKKRAGMFNSIFFGKITKNVRTAIPQNLNKNGYFRYTIGIEVF